MSAQPVINRLSHSFSILSAIALGAVLCACADMPTHSTSSSSSGSSRRSSSLVSKATWMNVLPGAMSDEFCSSESDLMQCYHSLSSDDCHQSVKQITTSCEQNYSDEIPSRLGRADTANWGGTIGNCTKDGVLQMIESRNLSPADDTCRDTVENM